MTCYSKQENPFPRRYFRTVHESFDLTRLLATRAVANRHSLGMISHPQSLTPALLELDDCPAFDTLSRSP